MGFRSDIRFSRRYWCWFCEARPYRVLRSICWLCSLSSLFSCLIRLRSAKNLFPEFCFFDRNKSYNIYKRFMLIKATFKRYIYDFPGGDRQTPIGFSTSLYAQPNLLLSLLMCLESSICSAERSECFNVLHTATRIYSNLGLNFRNVLSVKRLGWNRTASISRISIQYRC